MAADQRFRLALRDVAEALREINAPSMIIGWIAVIAAGVSRETIDIDATISGRSTDIEAVLARTLAESPFVSRGRRTLDALSMIRAALQFSTKWSRARAGEHRSAIAAPQLSQLRDLLRGQ